MNRFLRALLSLLLLPPAFLWAQPEPPAPPVNTTQLNMPLYTVNVVPVPSASVRVIGGSPGSATYYYWLVANYTVGSAKVAGPFLATNAPNVLSGSNYVQIAPVYPAGVTSIDTLRTTSPVAPSGACNCAVATGTTAGSINDQSSSLLSYSVSTFDPNNLTLHLADEVQSSGVSHLILRQGPLGTFVADLSTGGGSVTVTGSPIAGELTKFSGPNSITNAAATDVVNAFTGCSGTQYLGADGACHSASGSPPNGPTNSVQTNNGSGGFNGAAGTSAPPGLGNLPAQVALDWVNGVPFVTPDYALNYAPTSPTTLVQGSNTVTFAFCPIGMTGAETVANDLPHFIRINPAAGDTNPTEWALITGGTCALGSTNATLTFNAAFPILPASPFRQRPAEFRKPFGLSPPGLRPRLNCCRAGPINAIRRFFTLTAARISRAIMPRFWILLSGRAWS